MDPFHLVQIGFVLLATGCGEVPVVSFVCAHGEPLCETRSMAGGLDIDRIALYQGVETWLMDGGVAVVPENAPVVAGRDALFRVFVAPLPDWAESAEVTARIDFFDDGRFVEAVEATGEIGAVSDEARLESTLNVQVPGRLMTEKVSWRATLLGGPEGLEPGLAEWPETGGQAELAALAGAHRLRIGLVPVEYNGDNSGRLPDTSEAMIELYRSWMFRIYPTAEVEIEVLEPLSTNQRISADGTGWSELLAAVGAVRSSQGVDEDVYLYGAFCPDDSFSSFCSGGCVTGLSNLATSAGDARLRASIGLGFYEDSLAETMVHEVGHAHGRNHVDCGGASGVDRDYPYDGSSIGVRGYDLEGDSLKEPDRFADFMGYCWPVWTSDYTFDALFERIVAVNALVDGTLQGRVAVSAYQSVWAHSDGHLAWGQADTSAYEPGGVPRKIELIGASRHEMADAWFSPFDHLPGGMLVYRVPDWPVQAVAFEGAVTPYR